MRSTLRVLFMAVFCIGTTFAVVRWAEAAALKAVEIGSDWSLPAPRWRYGGSEKVKGSPLVKKLYRLSLAEKQGNFQRCLRMAQTVDPLVPHLRPWIARYQLRCARGLAIESKRSAALNRVVKGVERQSPWFVTGPAAPLLRKELVESLLVLMQAQMRVDHEKGWLVFDRIEQRRSWFDSKQMAEAYRLAGELAFIQQKLTLAAAFFQKSLDEEDSQELQVRLDGLLEKLMFKKPSPDSTGPSEETSAPAENIAGLLDLELSEGERKLLKRMQASKVSGDLIPLVKDGVSVITNYPGSLGAEWASKQVLNAYFTISRSAKKKYRRAKSKVVRSMLEVDAERLSQWAKRMSYRGHFEQSLVLGRKALKKYKGQPQSTEVLEGLASAALYMGDYPSALEYYQMLVDKHAGADEARRAYFRLGLIRYRQGKPSLAAAHLERLLALGTESDFDLEARYWLWRSHQKMQSEEAPALAQNLMKEYPLSYYGLRARAELGKGVGLWPSETKPGGVIKKKFWLTLSQQQAWKNLSLLLPAGWLEESQAELASLPTPKDPQEKIVFARLWSLAFDHFKAVVLVNKAWEEDKSLVQPKVIPLAYPVEFLPQVEKQAKAREVDPNLVLALIKQESSFRVEAVSPAKAMGLMQLIPSTARSVQKRIKGRALKIPDDLFDPEQNIQLGTSYLRQMLRSFRGNVPLSLAAYNAGIGRVRRWLRKRGELGTLLKVNDSNPDNEVWIDEMPWGETRFYVKAILRNLIVYRWLNEQQTELSDPIWK